MAAIDETMWVSVTEKTRPFENNVEPSARQWASRRGEGKSYPSLKGLTGTRREKAPETGASVRTRISMEVLERDRSRLGLNEAIG